MITVAMTKSELYRDHNKSLSLSNTTLVAIFPNLCSWRHSYAHTWEVLTLKNRIEPP